MDESILDRLLQLKRQMAEAVERSVVRHPEYGEQRLREELAPFVSELDGAAQQYEILLQNRPQKKKIKIPSIRLPKSPPPLPADEGPKSREEFVELFQIKPEIVESAIDRLLGRKAARPPSPPIPAFADWATQSAGESIVATTSAEDSTVRTDDPAPADWDSWMARTGAAPPANAQLSNQSPKTAPANNSPVEGVWSWANDSGNPAAASTNDAAVDSDAETKKRLQEWLERRQKSGG